MRLIWRQRGISSGWYILKNNETDEEVVEGLVPRLTSDKFYVLPHTRQGGKTMTSASAGHIILTTTQPVGIGRPQRESNSGPPHQESLALPRPTASREKNGSVNIQIRFFD